WQSGENDSFGLMIDQDNNNTLNFELQSNGKARVSKYVNGKNTLTTAFKETKQLSTFRQAVTQKIKILNKGKNYEYYVNEKVVDKGTVDFPINYIGLRACGEQVVHFDNLEIKKIEVKD
ncbi:MAG: hypothetical protein NZ521_05740, partial [Flammeovirgaceae bacterium]|nr:hypothetical protein [Flammeovirgaceae bacterium]MDW8288403.1 hypothetical protein [Flammeovirgaceae bacterium]